MYNCGYICMMISLNEHIEYLMMHHDCVIIPGWGALVAQYTDSVYDSKAKALTCPKRRLGFNASVNHNDGMLAQSLVRREGISYDQAVRFIEQNVAMFSRQLAANGELSLGRLGYFKRVGGNNAEFVPFDREMGNDQYFGLRNVPFVTLDELDNENEGAIIVEKGWWARKAIRTAASVAVLLVLSVLLTTPIIVNRNNHALAGLNTEVKGPKHQVIEAEETAELAVALPESAKTGTAQAVAQQSSNLLLDEGGCCFLVIASLNNPKQVNEYLAAHPDMAPHAQVMHNGKYYQVYVARSYQPSRLYSFMSKLPRGYQAWVLN